MLPLLLSLAIGLLLVGILRLGIHWMRAEELSNEWNGFAVFIILVASAGSLLLPFSDARPLDQAEFSAAGWACTHFITAGWLLILSVSSASTRSTGRPRKRTTRVAGILLSLTLLLPLLIGPIGLLVWPPCIAGLMWLHYMNRRAPGSFPRIRDATAALLLASSAQLALFITHVMFGYSLDDPRMLLYLEGVMLPAALSTSLFVAGLRVLVGSIPLRPMLLSLATGATLLLPPFFWEQREGLPDGASNGEWVDLLGRTGPPLRAARYVRCKWIEGPFPTPCHDILIFAAPSTPLANLPEHPVFTVDGGSRSIHSWGRWGASLHLDVAGDEIQVELNGEIHTFKRGPGLHSYLSRHPDSPLEVARSPNLTIQDFLTFCASMGPNPSCGLTKVN